MVFNCPEKYLIKEHYFGHAWRSVQDPARTAVYFLEPFLKEPPTNAIMIIIVVEKIQGTGSVFTHGRNVQVVPLLYVPIDENHNRHLHQVLQSS